jgi:hypothetical protein
MVHPNSKTRQLLGAALVACAVGPGAATAADMSFFITSVGLGKGANLGGLEGADKHCQSLAAAAGAGSKTWRAYLSTQGKVISDPDVIHARDRIGAGPWYNARGTMIARNVDDLHSANANLTKESLLDEKGQIVNGRTEKPNRHDILTGSRPDGTAFPPSPPFGDMTCGNWTKDGEDGAAMTGHHDRVGPTGHAWATSWNSAHPTRGGCGQTALQGTGGDGLFYCFAAQ